MFVRSLDERVYFSSYDHLRAERAAMGDSDLSRRDFCRTTALGAFGFAGAGTWSSLESSPEQGSAKLTPDQALARLRQGNAAFLTGTARVSSQDRGRRLDTAKTQAPFAH